MKKVICLFLSLVMLIDIIACVDLSAYAETDNLIFGDLNGDGKITITDVSKLQSYINGGVSLNDKEKVLADVDGNGDINVDDVNYLYMVVNNDIEASELPVYINPILSGICGNNATWSYNRVTYELIISGFGDMNDFPLEYDSTVSASIPTSPWYIYHDLIQKVDIQEGITSIGLWAFGYCSKITDINIPDSVNKIGSCAFENCYSLVNISLPETITTLSSSIFHGCKCLRNIHIPDTVTEIGAFAFQNCINIEEIIIPQNVSVIRNEVFDGCINLKDIIVDEYNKYFVSNNGVLFSKDKSELLAYPAGKKSTTYDIPDTVKKIYRSAFARNNYLEYINIPNNVTEIGYMAFYNCRSLLTITIPDSVKEISGGNCFGNCVSLTEVNLSNSVTKISTGDFRNCASLKKIVVPNSVIAVGSSAFEGCDSLENVIIGKNVTEISQSAFKNCSNLTDIVLPEKLTTIGYDAFKGCEKLDVAHFTGAESVWNDLMNSISLNSQSPLKDVTVHYITIQCGVSATCTETGSTDSAYCPLCDTYFLEKIDIQATGHNYTKIEEIESTCLSDGYIKYACLNCDSEYTQFLKLLGHSYDAGFITEKSTCITNGTKKFTCQLCGYSYTENMPTTDHIVIIDEAKAATCASTGLTEGSHCSVCNEVFEAQKVIPMIPHKYISSVVQATATSQGYTKYVCSSCGETYNTDYFNAATVYSDITDAKAGEIVKVPVYIRDNNGLMGWKLTFDYDTDVLTPISVENGEIINNGYLDNNIDGNMKPGSINVYWAGDDNNADNGIMFYINFAVNEDAVGKTNVDISFSINDTFDVEYNDVYLNCEPIVLNVENDKYTQSAKITSGCDNITAGDDLELKLNISEIQNVSAANITISYDSNVFDFKSVNSISGIFTKNIVSNGKVMLDVSGISKNADNKDFVTVLFKCKDNAASGDYNFNVTANESGIICKGCTVSVSPSATSELVKVYADDVNAKAGDMITIPIMIDNNHGIMGYGLNFTYDTNMLEIVSATRGTAFSGNFNDSIGVDDGKFIVLWNGTEDNLTNGVLLNLTFRVLSDEITDTVVNMTYNQDDTFNENWEDVVFDCKSINVNLNSHQHNYTVAVTEPTCTEKGYTAYICSCGVSYIADYTEAIGHMYKYTAQTTQGMLKYECNDCHAVITMQPLQIFAKWNINYVNKEPQRTSIDDSCYLNIVDDNIINSKDYAHITKLIDN